MSGGGKGGGGSAIVGYKYLMGVQLAICHGPVDAVRRIIIGERIAWEGSVAGNSTISINKPDLFGGDSREGGVVGSVDVMMGGQTQPRNAYLTQFQGALSPAYRGLLNLVFKSFMWSSGNPYFKAPWIEATRVLAGWDNDTPWNPADALIGTLDMNPAHVIYQCLTDSAWGMGYSTSDIGDASFRASATQLKTEGFGFSLPWDQQSSVEEFVKVVLNHINGAVGLNMATGKFELKLIRNDYNVNDLVELNEDNVLELKSFQRSAFGDSINEVVVTYTDRDGNTKPIAVQNLASISAQGSVISTTKAYPGIREPSLAARVALRDLATLASPLAQVTMITNRVLWDKEEGDVVKLVWPLHGLAGVPFRITKISKGTLTDAKISVSLVEDIFGLPSSSYTSAPGTLWTDSVVPPIAAEAALAVETPYWDIVKGLSLANRAQLIEGYSFGMFLASRGSVRSTLGYTLSASSDNETFNDVSTGAFSPTGRLVSTITPTQTSFYLSGGYDLDSVVKSESGGYLIIGNECMSVVSCNPDTGETVVGRGILDTVPSSHAANTRVFFRTPTAAFDPSERVSGEVVYYKPRPTTGIGTLALEGADTEALTLSNRASRPYPPGNFKIGALSYPATIPGPNVVVTWSHRDRAAQTVDFIDNTVGNIGPELGTTYRVRVMNGATVLRTYDVAGSVTTWSYPTADDLADGKLATLTITVVSVRDGLESLYQQRHTFGRIVQSGGVLVDGPPSTPVLYATPGQFSISLNWDFGDARTNIAKVELWVADVPDFSKGNVLRYEDYPSQNYLHEIGTVRAYKWYWARVADTSGGLSAWSNMVSGRADTSSFDPETALTQINTLLTDGSGAAKIEMLADRFSIKSPDGSKTPFAVVDVGGGVYKTLLNSDVLIGGGVDIANLKTGSLPNDVMLRLGAGIVELDGSGEIRVRKSLSPTADFVRLSSGEIRFMRYIGGSYQSYNYLSRLESGVANSGGVVTIPGYWKSQPKVMVSPAILSLYKATFAAQDQGISCTAQNLVETFAGSGVWQFTATATLNLAANTGGGAISASSGATSVNSFTTPTQVTPANCTSITPSVSLQSQRGNGASQYLYRAARWRVEYYSGGTWVASGWRAVTMGAQFGALTDSVVFTFPSAGAWQWRIYMEAYDVDGSVFGSISYTYSNTTVVGSMPVYTTNFLSNIGKSGSPISTVLSFGAATGSGEIYQVDYSWNATVSIVAASNGATTAFWGNDPGGTYRSASLSKYAQGSVLSQVWSGSKTSASYLSTLSGSFYEGTPTLTSINARLTMNSCQATIYRRTIVANTTTPSNTFALSSYTYSLATAQVLATGALNWLAVGE